MVKVDVSRRGRFWVMQVIDVDSDLVHFDSDYSGFPAYPFPENSWMGCIEWCSRELACHHGATRTSYDQWRWYNKSDLDKFLVIFYLRYA